jgi:HEAT repeat protein/ankyrin repeat protein
MTNDKLLFEACKNGELEEVKRLVKPRRFILFRLRPLANINSRPLFRSYPLVVAIDNGHMDIAKYLISKGASLELTDFENRTPLIAAIQKRNYEILEYLIENGADINFKNIKDDNKTPLHNSDQNAAKILISKGALLNEKDNKGNTPLHYAYMNNDKALIELLISNGADTEIKNDTGHTPKQVRIYERPKIITVLDMCPICKSGKPGNIDLSDKVIACPHCGRMFSFIILRNPLTDMLIQWFPFNDTGRHYITYHCPKCNGFSFHKSESDVQFRDEADDQPYDPGFCKICSGQNEYKEADLNQLIVDLSAGAERIRGLAALRLGTLQNQDSVVPLIEALKDESEFVRNNAALSLGEIKDIRAVAPLITALKNPDLSTRLFAVKALGKLGDKRAAMPLAELLKSEVEEDLAEEEIVTEAIKALTIIADPKTIPVFKEFLNKLLQEPPRMRDGFPGIDSVKRYYSFEVIKGLEKFGAAEPIISILDGKYKVEEGIKRYALQALVQIGDKLAVQPLLDIVSQSNVDNNIQEFAINALKSLGEKQAVQPIIELLSKPNINITIRKSAIDALGKLGDECAVQPLIKLILNDNNYKIVEDATKSLAGILNRHEEFYPFLDKMSKKDATGIRISAIELLAELRDKRAVQPLLDLLSQKKLDGSTRKSIINTISVLGDPRVVEPLIIRLLHEDDNEVSIETVKTLVKILNRHNEFQPLLENMLQKDKPGSRIAAIELLVELGDKRAVQPLIGIIFNSNNKSVISEAVKSLVKILNRFEELLPLINKISTTNTVFDIKMIAIDLLVELGDNRAVQPIIDFYTWRGYYSDDNIIAMTDALTKLGDRRVVKPLINKLDHSYSFKVQRKSIIVMGILGYLEAVEALKKVLMEPDVVSYRSPYGLHHYATGAIEKIEASNNYKKDLL